MNPRLTLLAIAGGLALAACPPLAFSGSGPADASLRLWYLQPAAHWNEALPVGNGRLGAMVFGGAATDRLQINEDTLWTGGPHAYQHEGAAAFLPEIRRLLADGRQKDAEALAAREFMSVPLRQKAYQPCVDVVLSFAGHDTPARYERSLDLVSAVAATRYEIDGTVFTRETFASHPGQVLVHRVAASRPGAVSFTARLTTPHEAPPPSAAGPDELLLTGSVRDGAMKFAARVRIVARGGRVSVVDGTLRVDGADEAMLLVSAATNFVNFQDVSGDPVARSAVPLAAAAGRSPADLRSAHVADHRALFDRVALDLGTSPAADLPTDQRLRAVDKTADPQIVTLLFQYGRYLLIASSRPGDQPANLQGLWNDQLNPPWGSKYTVNINTEMNYWPAEVANLAECAEPLFAMIDDLVVSGRETARAHYGARGWVLHHNTDLWRGTAPINASDHGIWPTGGAWLCQALWEHWLHGGDRDFLARRAYPAMKEAALFFTDTLVRDPATGRLISGPSNSPELGGLVMGPTMDHQIIRWLFGATAEAAAVLGVDADFAAQLTNLRAEIAPNRIGRHGQLQEWLEDKDDPANRHRHVSHLWGVFPGHEINPATPELFQAARQSLRFRGDDGTGWSLGWKICFWARFLDGDHAHRMILQQLRPVEPQARQSSLGGGTYPNLFDAHPPFQIDGNFAATAGVCEMLLQSQGDAIVLLPALPAAWPEGSVRGLRARGGAELDFSWRDGRLRTLTVRPTGNSRPLVIRHGESIVTLPAGSTGTLQFDSRLQPL